MSTIKPSVLAGEPLLDFRDELKSFLRNHPSGPFPRSRALMTALYPEGGYSYYSPVRSLEQALDVIAVPTEALLDVLIKDGSEARDWERADERSKVIDFIVGRADDLDESLSERGDMWTERARIEVRAEASKLREIAVLLAEGRHHIENRRRGP